MDLINLYNSTPVFIQNIGCSIIGMHIQTKRFGRLFKDKLSEYMSRDEWTYEQLKEYRDKEIRKIVKHCYENVPYYKRLFDNLGINYKEITKLEDLHKLPILTKQEVKDNFSDFFATNIRQKELIKLHTSGTTGSGFQFYTTKEADASRWAEAWRGNAKIGVDIRMWRGQFGGRSIVPIDNKKPPYYRINYPAKQVIFSAYHMNEENLKYYIEALNKYKLEWLHGYPSSISLIAKYMIDNNIKLNYNMKHITLCSENVQEIQVNRIKKAFGIIPFQNYAQTESVAIFRERKDHKMFVSEDIAAVEFIKDDTSESYKIIGTTLTNYAMPFLRYDTNDLATYIETKEGRQILKVDGRNEDYIVLTDGSKVGRLDHIFKDLVHVKEAQFVQEKIGEVDVNIVKGIDYTDLDEKKLLEEVNLRLGNKIVLKINYVKTIPRTANGKLRFVISRIK